MIGLLQQLESASSRLFGDRPTAQAEFKFDGVKGGIQWREKLMNYFISECPALLRILEWAERYEGEKIDTALLKKAIQGTAVDENMPDVKPAPG